MTCSRSRWKPVAEHGANSQLLSAGLEVQLHDHDEARVRD